MTKKWIKVVNLDKQGVTIQTAPKEAVYDITEEIVIRSVQYNNLVREREELLTQVATLEADLVIIEEMQAAELLEKT